jgi:hypothetical protein
VPVWRLWPVVSSGAGSAARPADLTTIIAVVSRAMETAPVAAGSATVPMAQAGGISEAELLERLEA